MCAHRAAPGEPRIVSTAARLPDRIVLEDVCLIEEMFGFKTQKGGWREWGVRQKPFASVPQAKDGQDWLLATSGYAWTWPDSFRVARHVPGVKFGTDAPHLLPGFFFF